MIILYKNKKARKQFSPEFKSKWRYSPSVSDGIEETENYIRAARNLRDIANYSPFHLERLNGNRKKTPWSIRIVGSKYRILLFPCSDDGIIITEGDILSQADAIMVIMVVEVSNHYE